MPDQSGQRDNDWHDRNDGFEESPETAAAGATFRAAWPMLVVAAVVLFIAAALLGLFH